METNFSAYIATGLWHYYLIFEDKNFLKYMLPTITKSVNFVTSMQTEQGDIYWASEEDKEILDDFDTSDIQSLCQFGRADIISLPFADCSLDAVICSEVLEHVDSPQKSIEELIRVLKPGGSLALSVPRYLPELMCWKLSKEYSKTPGGHVRIFRHNQLKTLGTKNGLEYQNFHWAHGLHSPYWWLQCLFWKTREKSYIVKQYHKLLVWDLMKQPLITRILEKFLQPLIGKSLVMYFRKPI